MRTITAIALFVSLLSFGYADILWTEDFQPDGYLTNSPSAWAPWSGAGAGVGSPTNSSGMAWLGQGQEDTAAIGAFPTQSGAVYAGLNLQVNQAGSGSTYAFGFFRSTYIEQDKWGFQGQVDKQYTLLGFGFTQSTVNATSGLLDEGTTYRVVIYFDGTDDHRFWINPDGTDFDSPDGQFTEAMNDPNGFFTRQADNWDNGDSNWGMGDLVVATTFNEVIGAAAIPEPTSALLYGMSLIGLFLARSHFGSRSGS